MTLGGLAIAIGELVDDAVVDVENVLRRLKINRANATPRPVAEVIAAASLEVRSAMVYATVIIVLVFVPAVRACPASRAAVHAAGRRLHRVDPGQHDRLGDVTPVLAYYLLPQMKQFTHTATARW